MGDWDPQQWIETAIWIMLWISTTKLRSVLWGHSLLLHQKNEESQVQKLIAGGFALLQCKTKREFINMQKECQRQDLNLRQLRLEPFGSNLNNVSEEAYRYKYFRFGTVDETHLRPEHSACGGESWIVKSVYVQGVKYRHKSHHYRTLDHSATLTTWFSTIDAQILPNIVLQNSIDSFDGCYTALLLCFYEYSRLIGTSVWAFELNYNSLYMCWPMILL